MKIIRAPFIFLWKFWMPTVIMMALLSLAFIYFTHQAQLRLLLERENAEIQEVAKVVTLTTKLALKYSDPDGIDGAVQKIADEHSHYAIAVYQKNLDGSLFIITSWPKDFPVRTFLARTQDYLISTEAIQDPKLPGGMVSVFLDLDLLDQLNRPLLTQTIIMVVSVFIVLSIFILILMVRLGNPIREMTEFTEHLLNGDYSGHLEGTHGAYEIGRLKSALNNLKIALAKQKSRNKELTSGLEFQISKKTHELKTVLERLSAAQKIAHIGNFIYWIDQDVWEMSQNTTEIFGESILEVTNQDSFIKFVHPDARLIFKDEFNRTILKKGRIQLDFMLDQSFGPSAQWVALVGEVVSSGAQPLHLAGTIQDISHRKEIESQIEQLSLVARLTDNGVLFTDENNLITWANDNMTKITGYTIAEIIGRSPSIFQSEKTSADAKRYIRDRLSERKNARVEIQNVTKDGSDYWVELHIEPILDSYDRVKGFLAIQVDITQRKNQETELQKTLEKQQELSQLKSRFLTMTSHEFRTPLTSIQATTEVLEILLESNKADDPQKILRYLKRIKNEIDRLTVLMDDILAIERFEAGRIPFKPDWIDLKLVLVDLLEERRLLSYDPRSISIEFYGEPRKVKMDFHLFSQIITNLATNALKYSLGKKPPVLKVEWGAEQVTMTMCDQGIGIPKQEQANLFQSFYRATNVENIQGTGLGLVIVKQFTEIHGGKISLESIVNQGTCVKLEFAFQNLENLHSNIA